MGDPPIAARGGYSGAAARLKAEHHEKFPIAARIRDMPPHPCRRQLAAPVMAYIGVPRQKFEHVKQNACINRGYSR
jgi:hypothetical protein